MRQLTIEMLKEAWRICHHKVVAKSCNECPLKMKDQGGMRRCLLDLEGFLEWKDPEEILRSYNLYKLGLRKYDKTLLEEWENEYK